MTARQVCLPPGVVAIHVTAEAAEKLAVAYGLDADSTQQLDSSFLGAGKPPCWQHGSHVSIVSSEAGDHYFVWRDGRHMGTATTLHLRLYGLNHLETVCT